MKRIAVHIGGPCEDNETLARALHANAGPLAEAGVLVPRAGTLPWAGAAIRHHALPWSIVPSHEVEPDEHVWVDLAAEIEASTADTVLLSSPSFTQVVADPVGGPALLDRLRQLSDQVVLIFVAGDQLDLLNWLYCQQVRALALSSPFEEFVAGSGDLELYDYAHTFEPLLAADGIDFVAVPRGSGETAPLLGTILAAVDVHVDPAGLVPVETTAAESPGPIAVEAFRLLGARFRGKHPEFTPYDAVGRRIRRRAQAAAHEHGWYDDSFWGWTPSTATAVAARFYEGNREFARRTWGSDWPLSPDFEREPNRAELVELSPVALNQIWRLVRQLERVHDRLRAGEAAA